jgi:starvation-inducible outer membrane lipoprotein
MRCAPRKSVSHHKGGRWCVARDQWQSCMLHTCDVRHASQCLITRVGGGVLHVITDQWQMLLHAWIDAMCATQVMQCLITRVGGGVLHVITDQWQMLLHAWIDAMCATQVMQCLITRVGGGVLHVSSASSHAHTCTIAEMHTPAISPIGHYICPCSDTQKRRRSTLTRTCASWRTRAHIYARICERQSLSSSNFLTPPQSRTYRVYVCCGNADRLNVAHPASVYVVTTHALELVEATLTTARAVHILKDVLWVRKLGNLALVQTCKLWAQPRSTLCSRTAEASC